MRFAIYSKTTGLIEKVIDCPTEELAQLNVTVDQNYLLVGEKITDTEHYIYQGHLADLPPKPSPFHVWRGKTLGWEDPRNLEALKQAKWEEIKAARNLSIDAPLIVEGVGAFDNKKNNRDDITDTFLIAKETQATEVHFPFSNGTMGTFTFDKFKSIALLQGAKVKAAYDKGRAIHTRIEEVTSSEALRAVTWD